jgi:tRNA modification GTPase
MPVFNDTIAALSTAVGTAAIAVIRITGPNTDKLVQSLRGSPLPERVARHGDYRDQSGAVVDDVIWLFFRGPKSYTGEDVLEISCHGNPFIAQKILDDLNARGCRAAEPGEFTQRAFLNGRMDLTQAEAVMDVIHARSERALAAANRHLRGSLGQKMTVMVDRLLLVLARVEAYIDFPDEDLPREDRKLVSDEVKSLQAETRNLLATRRYGDLLRDGIKTVIVGRPNVGKSSLLNCLVGADRALVSPEPGTTRDFIEERIVIGPHCLRLIDTAGLNPAPGELENLGIAKTHEKIAEADLLLVLLECGQSEAELPTELLPLLRAQNTVIVLTKSDLHDNCDTCQRSARTVKVSSRTGAGMEELTRTIVAIADSLAVGQDQSDAVAINSRHSAALDGAEDALASAESNLGLGGPTELLASDLRAALAAYGEIAGRVDNERMLDALFSTFCIGK